MVGGLLEFGYWEWAESLLDRRTELVGTLGNLLGIDLGQPSQGGSVLNSAYFPFIGDQR